MIWATLGALLLALSVLIGAFGAHALKDRLDAYATSIYERAVFYQFIHALGLLAIGLSIGTGLTPSAGTAGLLLLIGIFVFSGSLYALALSGIRKLGAITPLGGLAFVAGWIVYAIALTQALPAH
jgi:uncharacterized membrane protein YgdD (TMEM256/DUF423 family)